MSKPVDNRISGRLALITGASGGIGAACARSLHAAGMNLALTYSSNRASVEALVDSLRSSPPPSSSDSSSTAPTITVHHCDLASDADITRLFTELSTEHKQSGPDVLVVNAGYGKRISDIADIPVSEWDTTIGINLRASFLLCQGAVPHMREQSWGRIVLITSIAAVGGGINGCHYAASKAGLQGMGRNLATRLASSGITVNDVAPAMIGDTGMIPSEDFVKGTPGDVKNIPVGRLGVPEECANVVEMCLRTGYLTGQSILLAGGLK